MLARRNGFLVTLGLLALPLVSAPAARAGWPQVPTMSVPVCTTGGSQASPVILADGAGGAIVVWQDARNGNNDFYARHVAADGSVTWGSGGQAVCTAAGSQSSLTMCTDGAGGAIAAWRDFRSGTNFDIYAQRITAAGTVAWAANGVPVCTVTGSQYDPIVVSDGAGGAIIVWSDYRGGAYGDIYAQRISAAGAVAWTSGGVAICLAADEQSQLDVARDGAGGAVAVWADFRSGVSSDIYAQRISAGGAPMWAGNGIVICSAANEQSGPAAALDDAGGVVVTWRDARSATRQDLYAQRITIAGTAGWSANGRMVNNAEGLKNTPLIVADGTGGTIIAWEDIRGSSDWDVYAQRLTPTGDLLWMETVGLPITTAWYNQSDLRIVADGQGGAVLAWSDEKNIVSDDLYAQRIDGAGNLLWAEYGNAVSTGAGNQQLPDLAADGNGGFIVTWYDDGDGDNDIRAQRIEQFGHLGSPAPAISAVRDVPGDQGGQVKLSWDASYLDQLSDPELDYYDILRSSPPNVAKAAQARGARLVTSPADLAGGDGPCYLVTGSADKAYYWEYLAAVAALHYLSGYSYTAPTLGDSTAAGDPATAFMVVGRNSGRTKWWLSEPASGCSADNLGPARPTFLAASREGGATHVRWLPNTEADLSLYRLYRGADAGFTPGPGSLVVAHTNTGYEDAGAPLYAWYKLTAVDVHGNESPVATLAPSGIAGAPDDGVPLATRLERAVPNPFNPATTFAFALRAAGHVRLTVFDPAGRLVRVLVDGEQPAGRHEVSWDGRDARGEPLAAGVYLGRLEAGDYRATERVTLLK